MDQLRLAIGWLITIVWLASVIADAVVPGYDVPATVHALMLMVAGAFFGPTIMGRRNNSHD